MGLSTNVDFLFRKNSISRIHREIVHAIHLNPSGIQTRIRSKPSFTLLCAATYSIYQSEKKHLDILSYLQISAYVHNFRTVCIQ